MKQIWIADDFAFYDSLDTFYDYPDFTDCFFYGNIIPCNPLNITELYGQSKSGVQVRYNKDYDEFLRTCPRMCTEQYYDVKHVASDLSSE